MLQHRPPCPLKISFIWPGSIPDLKMSATLATNKFCLQCVSLIIRLSVILWLLVAIHHWQQMHTQIHQQSHHPLYKLSLLSFQTVHGPFPSLLWWCWKAPNPEKTWQLNPSRPYGNASEVIRLCNYDGMYQKSSIKHDESLNHHIMKSIHPIWWQKNWKTSNFCTPGLYKIWKFGRLRPFHHPGSPTVGGKRPNNKQAKFHEVPPEPDTLKLTFTGLGGSLENEDDIWEENNKSQQKMLCFI